MGRFQVSSFPCLPLILLSSLFCHYSFASVAVALVLQQRSPKAQTKSSDGIDNDHTYPAYEQLSWRKCGVLFQIYYCRDSVHFMPSSAWVLPSQASLINLSVKLLPLG